MKSILLLMMLQSNIIPVVNQPIPTIQSQQSQHNSIEVFIDDMPVMQKMGVDKVRECTIHVGSSLHEVKVYVDQQEYSLEQGNVSMNISISPENKELRIEGKDEHDQEVHRWIEIESIQMPTFETEITNGSYILNSQPTFRVVDNENFDCILLNRETDKETSLSSLNVESLSLDEMGDYSITFRHKEYPYIHNQVLQFFYTDQKPSAQINVESNQSQEGSQLSFIKSEKWIDEAYIEIQSPNEKRRIPFTETLHIDSIENQDFTTKVKLVVKDLFGQECIDEKEIRLDRRAPEMILRINGQKVGGDVFIFDAIDSLQTQLSENASIQMSTILNGKTIPLDDLRTTLNQLLQGQSIAVDMDVVDESGNKNQFHYLFQKRSVLPIQTSVIQPQPVQSPVVEEKNEEAEVQSVTTKNVSLQDYRVEERVYSLNDDHEVVMQQRIIAKKSKPSISVRFFALKDQSIKVLVKKKQDGLKNKVQWIKVNGQKISLKKPTQDDLGNMIYEIPLKQKRNKIEVKIVNEKGYTKRIEKVVELKPENEKTLSWYEYFFLWIQNIKNHFMYE